MNLTFKKLALLSDWTARYWAKHVSLTPTRAEVLFLLYDRPLIQKEIAWRLGVTPSVVSKIVTALEQKGVVERKGIPEDGRVRLITLTDAGIGIVLQLLRHDFTHAEQPSLHQSSDAALLRRFGDKLTGSAHAATTMRRSLARNDVGFAPIRAALALRYEPVLGRSRRVHAPLPVWAWPPPHNNVIHVTRFRGPRSDEHRRSGHTLGPPRSKWVPVPPRRPGARVVVIDIAGP